MSKCLRGMSLLSQKSFRPGLKIRNSKHLAGLSRAQPGSAGLSRAQQGSATERHLRRPSHTTIWRYLKTISRPSYTFNLLQPPVWTSMIWSRRPGFSARQNTKLLKLHRFTERAQSLWLKAVYNNMWQSDDFDIDAFETMSSVVVTVLLVLLVGRSVTPAQQSMNFNISSGDTVTAQDCLRACCKNRAARLCQTLPD